MTIIKSSVEFAELSAIPLFYLSNPLATYADNCDGKKKSRFELLWVVPANAILSSIAIPLACVAATINILAAGVFAFLSLCTDNDPYNQTTVDLCDGDKTYTWSNNSDGWMTAADANAEFAIDGLLSILLLFGRIFYPPLERHPD